uniref:UTP6 small subunit processome component n=1 Tax=Anolis carolinensis TaxID=28377 RepID=H9GF89_ANOCA|nr:PREDICTED: U3 small nucleolar RNA-associated protein 6 homolog [Anolis carolinensis]|eukprot:XP_003223271.3 PREDICTED: U3 small nucleolar RNA-associated protein 6 homolog [Anolis carolinensis]
MAERIEQRVEDRVPELEQLERVGLFTRKEIRAVVKKASALEYKIQRRALHKEDFISYIQYEINLLELIKKRRARIGYSFKKDEIEYSIVQRIHNVFKRATAKWKDDLQLWLSHVAFCKKWNKKMQLSKVFSMMLALHPNKPALWIMAAKWEMEDRLSSESARQLFLRALRFHPECPKLYQEYFRMELMHAEKQRKEKKEFEQAKMDLGEFNYSEEVLNGEMARIVYRNAIQKIKGAEFLLSLLSIAKLFDSTIDLQKEILENLQAQYTNDPLVWDYMARRELEIEALPPSEHMSKQSKALDMVRKEEQCCAVYEEAVTSLPSEDMWKCYVIFCAERFKRKTNSEELRQKRLERLLSIYSRAHELQLLPSSLYKPWLQLLMELDLRQQAEEVATAATTQFSHLTEMWEVRLQLLLKLNSDGVGPCFQEAIKVVNAKDSLPLWILWVEWSESANSKADTETLYQKSLLATLPADSVSMKEKYLEWAYRTGGYKKAKKVFRSLYESRPFSLEFFKKMIQIEKEQESGKVFNIREYYERALREFGATEPDLWLDYIREELNHPEGKPENCGNIHWRAMKALPGEQVDIFISKYTLLQTGHL